MLCSSGKVWKVRVNAVTMCSAVLVLVFCCVAPVASFCGRDDMADGDGGGHVECHSPDELSAGQRAVVHSFKLLPSPDRHWTCRTFRRPPALILATESVYSPFSDCLRQIRGHQQMRDAADEEQEQEEDELEVEGHSSNSTSTTDSAPPEQRRRSAIAAFPHLTTLDLAANRLTTVVIPHGDRSLPRLTHLLVQFNQIDLLHVRSAGVRVLNATHNNLFAIFRDAIVAPALRVLDLSHNHLRYLGGLLDTVPALEQLIVRNNRLLTLAVPPALAELRVLDAAWNALGGFESFNLRTTLADRPSKLATLTLSGNRMYYLRTRTHEPLRLPALERFVCAMCRIHGVDADFFTRAMPAVKVLRLRHNAIDVLFNLRPPPATMDLLDLSHNQFGGVFPSDANVTTPAIATLDLSHNKIDTMNAAFLRKITAIGGALILDDNRLTELRLPDLNETQTAAATLRLISLGHNPIGCASLTLIRQWTSARNVQLHLAGNASEPADFCDTATKSPP